MKSSSKRCSEHVARMVERKNSYQISVDSPEKESLLGRRRRRWYDNIKTDVKEQYTNVGGLIWFTEKIVVRCCEHSNGTLRCVRSG
jgi:hypothetical protein